MITSSDGVVQVGVNDGYAYVLIVVNAGTFAPGAGQIRVWRDSGAGPSLVRSGDWARVVGTTAVVVDNEAPLSVPVAYWVEREDGGLSDQVTAVVPLDDCEAWLKPISAPGLAVSLEIVDFDDVAFDQPTSVSRVVGRPDPVTEWDVETLLSGTLVARTRTQDDYNRLREATRAGVFLLQASGEHALPEDDLYLVRGSIGIGRPGSLPGWDRRLHSIPVQQVGRPATAGAPLIIPGLSYTQGPDGPGVAGQSYLDAMLAEV